MSNSSLVLTNLNCDVSFPIRARIRHPCAPKQYIHVMVTITNHAKEKHSYISKQVSFRGGQRWGRDARWVGTEREKELRESEGEKT